MFLSQKMLIWAQLFKTNKTCKFQIYIMQKQTSFAEKYEKLLTIFSTKSNSTIYFVRPVRLIKSSTKDFVTLMML